MTPIAGGIFTLPAGIQWEDIWYISERLLVIALIIALIGILLLKRLAARSIVLMVVVVVAVSVLTSMSGIGVIAYRMLGTAADRDVILDLMSIAGLAALLVALFVGRRLIKASRAISTAVQDVGDSGVYIAPPLTLPAELAELSDGLAAAHERLAKARSRERALEASRRELVAWVSHDLRTPLAGLRAMAEALEDQVVIDPREVSQYHTQIRREVDRLTLMIDDLFELSRIHAGALRLTRRMVGLEDLVAEVVASVEPVAGPRASGSPAPPSAACRCSSTAPRWAAPCATWSPTRSGTPRPTAWSTSWPRCRAAWPASACPTRAAASRPATCPASSTSPSAASPRVPPAPRRAPAWACPSRAASSRPTPARSPSATQAPAASS